MFNDGSLDVAASSGYWRLGTIGTAIVLMITHPFGAGFDTTFSTIQGQLAGSAGGALMAFGAALGIIPFIATIVWHIKPIIRDRRLDIPAQVAFAIMYFQISFAQTKVFYPFLVAIAVLVVVTSRDELYREEQVSSLEEV